MPRHEPTDGEGKRLHRSGTSTTARRSRRADPFAFFLVLMLLFLLSWLQMCVDHCSALGAAFMATQYGFECWCSTDGGLDYDRHYDLTGEDAVCDLNCFGDEVLRSFFFVCGKGATPKKIYRVVTVFLLRRGEAQLASRRYGDDETTEGNVLPSNGLWGSART